MCIRITFGHSDKELAMQVAQARQTVIDAFRQSVKSNLLIRIPGGQALRTLLNQPSIQAPERWAAQVAALLVEAISQIHTRSVQAEAEAEQLRRQREAVKKQPEQRRENPRQEEVRALARERSHWQDAANQWRAHAEELKGALERSRQAQQYQQAEIDRLQQEIAGLEDTIVEQQEELNAFYNQS